MKSKLVKVSLYIEKQQATQLKAWSDGTLIPFGALVRRAIDETLETHNRDYQDALAATEQRQNSPAPQPPALCVPTIGAQAELVNIAPTPVQLRSVSIQPVPACHSPVPTEVRLSMPEFQKVT